MVTLLLVTLQLVIEAAEAGAGVSLQHRTPGAHVRPNQAVFWDLDEIKDIQIAAADNVKRVKVFADPPRKDWSDASMQSLYHITPFLEWKTAWHPVGM